MIVEILRTNWKVMGEYRILDLPVIIWGLMVKYIAFRCVVVTYRHEQRLGLTIHVSEGVKLLECVMFTLLECYFTRFKMIALMQILNIRHEYEVEVAITCSYHHIQWLKSVTIKL